MVSKTSLIVNRARSGCTVTLHGHAARSRCTVTLQGQAARSRCTVTLQAPRRPRAHTCARARAGTVLRPPAVLEGTPVPCAQVARFFPVTGWPVEKNSAFEKRRAYFEAPRLLIKIRISSLIACSRVARVAITG
jgi:hypothetical protein